MSFHIFQLIKKSETSRSKQSKAHGVLVPGGPLCDNERVFSLHGAGKSPYKVVSVRQLPLTPDTSVGNLVPFKITVSVSFDSGARLRLNGQLLMSPSLPPKLDSSLNRLIIYRPLVSVSEGLPSQRRVRYLCVWSGTDHRGERAPGSYRRTLHRRTRFVSSTSGHPLACCLRLSRSRICCGLVSEVLRHRKGLISSTALSTAPRMKHSRLTSYHRRAHRPPNPVLSTTMQLSFLLVPQKLH